MRITSVCAAIALMLVPFTNALAQERAPERKYEAMKGVDSVQTVFDFRVGDPEVALAHLGLIHDTVNARSMTRAGDRPDFVVVLIGPSAKLVSTDDSEAAKGPRNAIAQKIAAMKADGVKFEICMTTVHALDISADSILPEVVKVGNGWISVIGYQPQGYSMVADF